MTGTALVKKMASGRFALAGGAEAVGEFLAVVGEDFLDGEGGFFNQALEEIAGVGGGFLGQDFDIDPARGAVDGDKQVLMRRLIRHLRQVFDINVDEPWSVVLKRLDRFGLAFRLRDQRAEVGDAVTAQTTIQARTRDRRVDELAGHRQQIVQRQQQNLAQRHHHLLLHRAQGGVNPVRTVRRILTGFAPPPFPHGGAIQVVFARQFALRFRRGAQFLTNRGGGASVAMQVQIHGQGPRQVGDGVVGSKRLVVLSSSRSVRSASRAWNKV